SEGRTAEAPESSSAPIEGQPVRLSRKRSFSEAEAVQTPPRRNGFFGRHRQREARERTLPIDLFLTPTVTDDGRTVVRPIKKMRWFFEPPPPHGETRHDGILDRPSNIVNPIHDEMILSIKSKAPRSL
ncbi:hypothetical protein BJ508DRAFT_316419, partial [Ascobolus immersus RN42]